MKTNYLKLLVALWIASIFVACDDEQLEPKEEVQATDNTEELVKFKTEIDNITFNRFSNGLKNSDQNGRRTGVHRFSHFFKSRKDAQRVADIWDTCALITIKENEDGTYTLILNFGEGCEESDGRFLTGIVAFTGYETDSSGAFQIGFENFSEIKPGEEKDRPFTLSGWYHGEWTANPSDKFKYAERFSESFELDYENGEQENFAAEGEFFANDLGIVVTKHNFQGTNTKGDVYSGVTVNPLIYDFRCTESYIYTKGTEVYSLNGDSAAVDFGDGTCDNILTIQADGITVIIDLDEVD
ncbi:MAG: hypothetical protein R3345_14290 [Fulvivirga sp.]|nr:hypothetical protein [Fulvivirga sp.]